MGGEDVTSSAPRLDYAQRPPRLTRKRVRGLVLLTIGVAMVAVGTVWWDDAESAVARWNRRRQLNALQANCMAYVPPDGQVVYEEDSKRAADLAASTGYRAVQVNAVTQTNTVWATTNPTQAPLPVVHVPPLWAEYVSLASSAPGPGVPGLAFMQERTSAGGYRALVCVGSMMELRRPAAPVWEEPRWGMLRALYAWSFKPESGQSPDDRAPSGMLYIEGPDEQEGVTFFSNDPAAPMASPFPMRLYAGRIDPNDASRFTIDYELLGIGHRGSITGVLKDDGSVWLTPDAGRFPPGGGATIAWQVPTTRPTTGR